MPGVEAKFHAFKLRRSMVVCELFKIIKIGRFGTGNPNASRGTGNEVGKFAFELYLTFLLGLNQRKRIHQSGEVGSFIAVVGVHPPNGIGDGFVSNVYFLSKRTLR